MPRGIQLHLLNLQIPARWLFIAALLNLHFTTEVWAALNITVDDQNPAIIYSPAGAWGLSANSSLDSGGAHMLTQNAAATAVFRFTGTAIYFLAPLWPYTVNTVVSLDGGPTTLIDLVDHSRPLNNTAGGPETAQSQVVWSATALNDTQHVLNISVGAGQAFGVVDGLIYTNPGANATSSIASPAPTLSPSASSTSSSTSASTSTTDRVVASATPIPSTFTSSSSKNIIPVALGTILGIIGVFLLMIGMWFFFRRRRRPVSEAWTVGENGSPTAGWGPSGGPGSNPNAYWVQPHSGVPGYPMEQTAQGTWQNARYGYVGMPPPSIPTSLPPGAYHDPHNRAPNRYQPGYTLSTITEKSTPQMLDGGRTPLAAHSPASLAGQSAELANYTPPPGPQALAHVAVAAALDAASESATSAGWAGVGAGGGAGIGAGGRPGMGAGVGGEHQHYTYTHGHGYGNRHPHNDGNSAMQENSAYSSSSSSSTAVASESRSGHGERKKDGQRLRHGTGTVTHTGGNGNEDRKSHSRSQWT